MSTSNVHVNLKQISIITSAYYFLPRLNSVVRPNRFIYNNYKILVIKIIPLVSKEALIYFFDIHGINNLFHTLFLVVQ